MHTVSFYTIRALLAKGKRNSFSLGNLKNNNLKMYDVIKSYINKNSSAAINDDEERKSIDFNDCSQLNFDDDKKLIYGYVNVGKYGESTEIKDRQSQETKFKGSPEDIYYNERYIMIYVPDFLTEGFVAIHSVQRKSPKKILFDNFQKTAKAQHDLEIRFNPLIPKNLPQEILDSDLKEIKATGFMPQKDIADCLNNNIPNLHTELIIRNRNSSLGKLKNFLNTGKTGTFIEVIDRNSEKIKLTVNVGTRKLVYKHDDLLNKGASFAIPDNEIDISLTTGVPILDSLHNHIKEYINLILNDIYSGQEVRI